MKPLCVRLFGRLSVDDDQQSLKEFESRKAQELFAYLLLNHSRAHSREVLATLFWGDSPTAQTRKSLRHALWVLQRWLERRQLGADPLLSVEPEWVRLNLSAAVWVDALALQEAIAAAERYADPILPSQVVTVISEATESYGGDLLQGCYQEWCILERERLQSLYIQLLDRLMAHCSATGMFERGLSYGERILRSDRARERTYREMMRLTYNGGDRSGALRLYERCVAALSEELGVLPSTATRQLCAQIRDDVSLSDAVVVGWIQLSGILSQLRALGATLADTQQRVQLQIQEIEQALEQPG